MHKMYGIEERLSVHYQCRLIEHQSINIRLLKDLTKRKPTT